MARRQAACSSSSLVLVAHFTRRVEGHDTPFVCPRRHGTVPDARRHDMPTAFEPRRVVVPIAIHTPTVSGEDMRLHGAIEDEQVLGAVSVPLNGFAAVARRDHPHAADAGRYGCSELDEIQGDEGRGERGVALQLRHRFALRPT